MKKVRVLLALFVFLTACELRSPQEIVELKTDVRTIPDQSSFSLKNTIHQDALPVIFNSNSHSAFAEFPASAHLDLYPNIETIGVVVSGANLPATADLQYRQTSETIWHVGHPLTRIDDGRLVGSLFELTPATSYNIKVLNGGTEINGLITTQPSDLQFTPTVVLHVNDDAPAGGDGSIALPFKTIQEGINHAAAGTQILVSDGIYHEAITFPASGNSNKWIQVKAEGGGAILDGAEILSGNIWTPYESKTQIWSAKIGASIGYLARDQNRFYMYDDLAGLLAGLGHNNTPMNEGWVLDPGTGTLYVRSLDNPSTHTWQVPRLNHAFSVESRDWIWIEGFEMRFYGLGNDGCGVCTKNVSHLVVRKNRIHNLQLGIFINWTGGDAQGNDSRVEFNEIYDPPVNEWPWKAVKGSSMEGTAIVVRGHIGAIVRNNTIHNFFNGIYTGSSGDLENPAVAFDVDVYNNYIHHVGDDGLEPEGACVNHRFRNNVVDSVLVGISLAPITQGPTWVLRSLFTNYSGKAFKWDRNSDGVVLVYHNTSWSDVKETDAMGVMSPLRNTVLRNNIFRSRGYSFEESLSGSVENSWNNDNWYTTRGLSGPHFKWENVSFDTAEKLCAATGFECKGFEDPPGLSNPSGGDFRLLASSPNVDRGVVIPGINDKFSGASPDVGAIEFVIDPPPVVLSIVRTDINPSNLAAINFTVTFSEPVAGVDILAPFNDFGVVSPGITSTFISSVIPISAAIYIVSINTGSGNGSIRLDLVDDDSIVDAANSSLAGTGLGNGNFTSGEVYTIDKTPPAVSGIMLLDPSPTFVDTVRFTVNFTKEVSGVDASDFTLTTAGGISGAAIGEISGFGFAYTVTVFTGYGDGSLRLDLVDNDSIVDVAANPLGGFGSGNGTFTADRAYMIDKTAPMVTGVFRGDPTPTSADNVRFVVMFSESVSGVDASDFQLITGEKIPSSTITSVSGSTNTYTITVAAGVGNGKIRLDLIDNDSIFDAIGLPLGGAGMSNGNFITGEEYTVNKIPFTVLSQVFNSKGTNDGWILETSEDSNRGGSKDANSTTFIVGDDPKDRQYRAILNFPTKDLPDNAVIIQAILMIKKQEIVGSNPFLSHNNISIDIRYGVFGAFGPLSFGALPAYAFQANASRNAIGMIRNDPVGDWYWALLDSTAHPYINLTGVTQLRLLFQIGDNDDQKSNYLKFFSGDYQEVGDRPQLLIKYYVPK